MTRKFSLNIHLTDQKKFRSLSIIVSEIEGGALRADISNYRVASLLKIKTIDNEHI